MIGFRVFGPPVAEARHSHPRKSAVPAASVFLVFYSAEADIPHLHHIPRVVSHPRFRARPGLREGQLGDDLVKRGRGPPLMNIGHIMPPLRHSEFAAKAVDVTLVMGSRCSLSLAAPASARGLVFSVFLFRRSRVRFDGREQVFGPSA
jgi:hypothetical protein